MSREDAQVNFRIPHALKHKLVQAAHVNKRSVTAELVARLEDSFQEKVSTKDMLQIVKNYEALLRELTENDEAMKSIAEARVQKSKKIHGSD